MVTTCPLISKSSSSCTNLLVKVPKAPIAIGITVTFTVFEFPCKVRVLVFLFTSFQFYCVVSWDSKVHNSVSSLFFVDFFLVWPRLRDSFISQNPTEVCASQEDSGCAYTIRLYGQFQFLAQFPVDHLNHLVVSSLKLILCKFSGFTYYVIDRFVSITTSAVFISYLFFLWNSWSLWRCFMLLLEEIQFLS